MRTIVPILIALFAIMGIAAAEVRSVEIISPQEQVFFVGTPIYIDAMVTGNNVGEKYVRTLVDGVPIDECGWIPTSAGWVPNEAGEYTIRVEAATNRGFTNPKYDTVTITVI